MTRNAGPEVSSNDEQMWADYHRSRPGTVVHALNTLKTTVICRLFASKILSMSGPVRSVLELGCGTASTLDEIASRTGARCVGVDRSPEAIAIARAKYPRLELELGDIFQLGFERRSFDLVYSVGLFEHFTRAEQRQLLEIHASFASRYVAMMVPADSVLMNSILFVNKRMLGRSGTWADEQVFSPRILGELFPEYRFDGSLDHRFANLIMWFGWSPAEPGAGAPAGRG
jgi:SAM-dependent methyltransferase